MTDDVEPPKRKGGKKAAGAEGAKAAGAGRKKEGGAAKKKEGGEFGDPKAISQIARLLVRAIWSQEWSVANPDGQTEQRKAAWKEAREAAVVKNHKTYRRALNSLSRAGVTMTMSEAASKKAAAEDDDGED